MFADVFKAVAHEATSGVENNSNCNQSLLFIGVF